MPDHPLSEAVRSWVEDVAGAAVTSARPLPGGTHADTYLVTTGPGRDVVVRTFPPGDSAAGREARVLGALDGLDGLCPRLVASDADGSLTGGPATVISRLRGTADITAGDPNVWAADLGRALARVLLYGERIADALTRAYTSERGGAHPADPLPGDLWAVSRSHTDVESWAPNYAELGRTDLDAGELRRRHDDWTARLLARG